MSGGFPPLRDELRGIEPYGAPQMSHDRAPVQLNVNENPYAPSEALATSLGQAISTMAVELNRYPDREFVALREQLSLLNRSDLGEFAASNPEKLAELVSSPPAAADVSA